MEFFTADDVLNYSTAPAADEPVTVRPDDSILEALEVMLENDFDQLPVVDDGYVEGVITYKSVAKYVKSIDEPRIDQTSVSIALNRDPEFVDLNHDIFELFETLAEDEYVLIGDRRGVDGILTRYDVFYFLEYQVEPFLKIGEIEESLRALFDDSIEDTNQRIRETFADRAEHDERYDPPERLEEFSFDEYRMFMMRNLDQLPSAISRERDTVEELLEEIRDIRNALFHFRAEADEVDRDVLDIGHAYFVSLAERG